MTTTPPDQTRLDQARLDHALRACTAHPMRDGDVVMLLDDTVCLELALA